MFSLLPGWNRNDPTTWNDWPEEGMVKHGMPSRAPVLSTQALKNRQNANVSNSIYLISYLFISLTSTEDDMIFFA